MKVRDPRSKRMSYDSLAKIKSNESNFTFTDAGLGRDSSIQNLRNGQGYSFD